MTLSARHHNELTGASSIDEAVITERGYRTLRWSPADQRAREFLLKRGISDWVVEGRRGSGLYIPMYNTLGENGYCQWKPTEPLIDARGKVRKYLSPTGPLSLDCHPRHTELLREVSVPLWITEGAKKGDSLTSTGRCAISLTGVDTWRNTSGPLGEWENVVLRDRKVVICFDADAETNNSVRSAMARLGEWLKSRGARVHYLVVPRITGGVATKGVDDYLAAGGEMKSLVRLCRSEPPSGEKKWQSNGSFAVERMKTLRLSQPPRMVVQNLIAPGATLFAAGKKVGKSLLFLHIAAQIARGRKVFGELITKPGRVLYLSGEDSVDLPMWRLRALLAPEIGCTFDYTRMDRHGETYFSAERVTDRAQATYRNEAAVFEALDQLLSEVLVNLDIVTGFPRLDEGLLDYMRSWCDEFPGGVLAGIDTLERIKPNAPREKSLVRADYETTQALEEFALAHGIAIVALSHQSKGKFDDHVLRVSGTGGLTGPVSNILGLDFGEDRSLPTRTLELASRVIESTGQISIRMTRGELITVTNDPRVTVPNTRSAILISLKNRRMSPKQVTDVTGLDYNLVKKTLTRMRDDGDVCAGQGRYWLP